MASGEPLPVDDPLRLPNCGSAMMHGYVGLQLTKTPLHKTSEEEGCWRGKCSEEGCRRGKCFKHSLHQDCCLTSGLM